MSTKNAARGAATAETGETEGEALEETILEGEGESGDEDPNEAPTRIARRPQPEATPKPAVKSAPKPAQKPAAKPGSSVRSLASPPSEKKDEKGDEDGDESVAKAGKRWPWAMITAYIYVTAVVALAVLGGQILFQRIRILERGAKQQNQVAEAQKGLAAIIASDRQAIDTLQTKLEEATAARAAAETAQKAAETAKAEAEKRVEVFSSLYETARTEAARCTNPPPAAESTPTSAEGRQ